MFGVPNPFSHIYHVTQNPNTLLINSQWGKNKKRFSEFQFEICEHILPFSQSLTLMQNHSEMRGFPCPSTSGLLCSGADTSWHTHTQFQATGKDSEGLVQEIYKNVGLKEEWENVQCGLRDSQKSEGQIPSWSGQRITVWDYLLYQQQAAGENLSSQMYIKEKGEVCRWQQGRQ